MKTFKTTRAITTFCLFAVTAAHSVIADPARNVITVTVGEPATKSQLDLGITFNQLSLRETQYPESTASAKSIISRLAHYQNSFIMGWGAKDPEPSPGVYDWTSLDRRMAIVRETGGTPVITLCCAPDWMKGAASTEDYWKRIGVAPLPEHFRDFAELARQVALRYPNVKYYQVWSELKGFWNHSEKRWDYEGYTTLYNLVYDTLKAASPDIKVGGPYTPMQHYGSPGRALLTTPISGPYGTVIRRVTDAFQYWLAHNHGADFVSVDGHIRPNDGTPVDLFASLQFYTDINHWIRQQTKLPIWWAEWYSTPDPANPLPDNLEHARQNALMTATLVTMAPTVSLALRWGPESNDKPPYTEGDQDGMWSSTQLAGGGQPLPFASSVENFEHCFPPGQTLLATHASGPGILSMASPDCVLLINETAASMSVNVEGKGISLDPFGVIYSPRH